MIKTIAVKQKSSRRLSICENILFDCGIRQALQNLPNICIDADGLPLDPMRANRLSLIDTDVDCVRILRRHLPEGVLDDDRCVVFIAHHSNSVSCSRQYTGCLEKLCVPADAGSR